MTDITYKCSSEIRSGNKLSYRTEDNRVAVTDQSGNGRYVILSKRDARELALDILSQQYDMRFHPGPEGTRRIDMVEKLPPAPKPQVGEYYRVKGSPDMIAPWCDSPVARVMEPSGSSYIHLQTADGSRTGWSNMRKLEGPLEVTVQETWTVEG